MSTPNRGRSSWRRGGVLLAAAFLSHTVTATAADDDRIDGFGINDHPDNPRRLRVWQSTLTLLAAWFLLAAAAAAWRYRAAPEAWTLLAAAVATLSGLLLLSNPSAAWGRP